LAPASRVPKLKPHAGAHDSEVLSLDDAAVIAPVRSHCIKHDAVGTPAEADRPSVVRVVRHLPVVLGHERRQRLGPVTVCPPVALCRDARHGTAHTREEVEEVLVANYEAATRSRSSGQPEAFGWTASGKYLTVVFERVSDDPLSIYPITAYEVPPPSPGKGRKKR
jgi:hypothetical protein